MNEIDKDLIRAICLFIQSNKIESKEELEKELLEFIKNNYSTNIK
jgi:hypothetical protein